MPCAPASVAVAVLHDVVGHAEPGVLVDGGCVVSDGAWPSQEVGIRVYRLNRIGAAIGVGLQDGNSAPKAGVKLLCSLSAIILVVNFRFSLPEIRWGGCRADFRPILVPALWASPAQVDWEDQRKPIEPYGLNIHLGNRMSYPSTVCCRPCGIQANNPC